MRGWRLLCLCLAHGEDDEHSTVQGRVQAVFVADVAPFGYIRLWRPAALIIRGRLRGQYLK